jgi:NADH-quinone oxidoreductase subunit C
MFFDNSTTQTSTIKNDKRTNSTRFSSTIWRRENLRYCRKLRTFERNHYYLYQHPTFKFQFLTDLGGIHFPQVPSHEFGVIYHLHSLENNVRLIIKLYVSRENIAVPTLTGLYACANWMEREAFDFYGITFTGHPKMERILNVEDMDYHPMRKEYPLEDATREDKIDALFGR